MWLVETENIVLFPKTSHYKGRVEVDIAANPKATINDLVASIDKLEQVPGLRKERLPEKQGPCYGCNDSCCRDSLIFLDKPALLSLVEQSGVPLEDWVKETLDPELLKAGVPILKGPPCIFLKDGLCRIYGNRPAICRLFLCTPTTELFGKVLDFVTGFLVAQTVKDLTPFQRLNGIEASNLIENVFSQRVYRQGYREDLIAFAKEWCQGGDGVEGKELDSYDIELSRIIPPDIACFLFRLSNQD